MEPELARAASLLPSGAHISGVGYGCTSAASQIGPARVASQIRKGIKTPVVTEPVSALIAACKHLNIRRLGLVTPYIPSVSDHLRSVLQEASMEVSNLLSFEEPVEENVVRIAPDALFHAGIEMGRTDDCDAVFLSCTNLRTLDVIVRIETEIGKPVMSSNQVLAWHLGNLCGFDAGTSAFGALFGAPISARTVT
jgi:maleate isomerase